jgi:hypothetical protein
VGAEAAGAEAVLEVEVEAVVEIVGDMQGDAGDPGDSMRDDSSSDEGDMAPRSQA